MQILFQASGSQGSAMISADILGRDRKGLDSRLLSLSSILPLDNKTSLSSLSHLQLTPLQVTSSSRWLWMLCLATVSCSRDSRRTWCLRGSSSSDSHTRTVRGITRPQPQGRQTCCSPAINHDTRIQRNRNKAVVNASDPTLTSGSPEACAG
jgi:hypothetical protein